MIQILQSKILKLKLFRILDQLALIITHKLIFLQ
jgi:hypothetical protein